MNANFLLNSDEGEESKDEAYSPQEVIEDEPSVLQD